MAEQKRYIGLSDTAAAVIHDLNQGQLEYPRSGQDLVRIASRYSNDPNIEKLIEVLSKLEEDYWQDVEPELQTRREDDL